MKPDLDALEALVIIRSAHGLPIAVKREPMLALIAYYRKLEAVGELGRQMVIKADRGDPEGHEGYASFKAGLAALDAPDTEENA